MASKSFRALVDAIDLTSIMDRTNKLNRTEWRGNAPRSVRIRGMDFYRLGSQFDQVTHVVTDTSGDITYFAWDGEHVLQTVPLYDDIEFNDIEFGEEMKNG